MNPVTTGKEMVDKSAAGAAGLKVAVVVPAYNEEALIRDTMNNIPDFVDVAYIVDDGSTDATGQIIKDFPDPRIRYIPHHRNGGVGAAIVTGYKRCLEDGMDIAIVMAGDNQMDPAHALKLIQPIMDGKADYAKGDRLSVKGYQTGMSKWRQFGNWLLTWITRVASGNFHITDPQNGYTAITSAALRKINFGRIYPGYGYCNDMLVKLSVLGFKIVDVPMPARYGHEKSKIKYSRYIPRVSWLLFVDFLWRLKETFFRGNKAC